MKIGAAEGDFPEHDGLSQSETETRANTQVAKSWLWFPTNSRGHARFSLV